MLEYLFDQMGAILPSPGSRMSLPLNTTAIDVGKLRFIKYISDWQTSCVSGDHIAETLYKECQAALRELDEENAKFAFARSGLDAIAASPGYTPVASAEDPGAHRKPALFWREKKRIFLLILLACLLVQMQPIYSRLPEPRHPAVKIAVRWFSGLARELANDTAVNGTAAASASSAVAPYTNGLATAIAVATEPTIVAGWLVVEKVWEQVKDLRGSPAIREPPVTTSRDMFNGRSPAPPYGPERVDRAAWRWAKETHGQAMYGASEHKKKLAQFARYEEDFLRPQARAAAEQVRINQEMIVGQVKKRSGWWKAYGGIPNRRRRVLRGLRDNV